MKDDLKKWRDAREYCREMGGDLVSITNKKQQGKNIVILQLQIHFIIAQIKTPD